MVEQGAAPAGGDNAALRLPGGAGPRPGTLGCPARSSLTAWALGSLAESADRTPSDAAMERREAPHLPVEGAHIRQWTRRSALHPLGFEGDGEGKSAYPGRQRIRAISHVRFLMFTGRV